MKTLLMGVEKMGFNTMDLVGRTLKFIITEDSKSEMIGKKTYCIAGYDIQTKDVFIFEIGEVLE